VKKADMLDTFFDMSTTFLKSVYVLRKLAIIDLNDDKMLKNII
jgi:hypothetical protein